MDVMCRLSLGVAREEGNDGFSEARRFRLWAWRLATCSPSENADAAKPWLTMKDDSEGASRGGLREEQMQEAVVALDGQDNMDRGENVGGCSSLVPGLRLGYAADWIHISFVPDARARQIAGCVCEKSARRFCTPPVLQH